MKAQEDADFWYAYRAFVDHNIMPSDYAKLDVAEKAILIAFIDTHVEQQNKAAKGG